MRDLVSEYESLDQRVMVVEADIDSGKLNLTFQIVHASEGVCCVGNRTTHGEWNIRCSEISLERGSQCTGLAGVGCWIFRMCRCDSERCPGWVGDRCAVTVDATIPDRRHR